MSGTETVIIKDLGPLTWQVPITVAGGRPTPEFQRAWDAQRANNGLIFTVTFGSGMPSGVPSADGLGYINTSTTPYTFYVSKMNKWHQVSAMKFTDLLDAPHSYAGAGGKLVRVNSGATGLEFDTISQVLDSLGATQGDILYRGASGWVALAPGTSGQFLETLGASANPQWASVGGTISPIASGDILSNITGSSALPVGNTLSATLDFVLGSSQGDIIYRNASGWVVLAPGTNGYYLQTQGSGANPQWAAVTSLPSIANNDILSNISGSAAAPIGNTLTATIDSAIGNTQGALLYRNSSGWVILSPGTSGQFLETLGASANPQWASITGLSSIANNDLLANTSGSSAIPIATTLSALIDSAIGNTQGDILYRDSSLWKVLAPGTSGQFLQTLGTGANPQWATPSGGGGGAVTLISKIITSSQNSVTFSSILSSYTHLMLRIWGRSTAAVFNDDVYFQFNGDTGTNYSREYINSNVTSSPTSGQENSVSHGGPGSVSGASATTNFAGHSQCTLFGYSSTAFNKTYAGIFGFANAMGSGQLGVGSVSGVWNNTAPITSIKVYTSSGSNFVNGTIVSLYGIS